MNSRMTLHYVGKPDARRFYIERADGRYWTGLTWVRDRCSALLFADLRMADDEYNRLQLMAYQSKPVQTFECPLRLHVHGDQPFTVDGLRAYLLRALRIGLDVEAQGEGPVEDVFVLPVVMLDSLHKSEKDRPDLTTEELLTLARQANLSGDSGVDAKIVNHPKYSVSYDAKGERVTVYAEGRFLTENGWIELDLYDADGCLRADIDYPDVPLSVFLNEFPDMVWKVV